MVLGKRKHKGEDRAAYRAMCGWLEPKRLAVWQGLCVIRQQMEDRNIHYLHLGMKNMGAIRERRNREFIFNTKSKLQTVSREWRRYLAVTYNLLPTALKEDMSDKVFKKELKKWLHNAPDELLFRT